MTEIINRTNEVSVERSSRFISEGNCHR